MKKILDVRKLSDCWLIIAVHPFNWYLRFERVDGGRTVVLGPLTVGVTWGEDS